MRRLLVTVALVGLAVVAVLAVVPLREAVGHALHGDIHALRSELRGLGVVGAIVLVGLILTHAVVFFPADNTTAGLVFGFAVGLPLVVVAWLASGLIAYWLGVFAGRPLAIRLAGENRVAIAERVIDRGGAPAAPARAPDPVRALQPRRLHLRRHPRPALALRLDVGPRQPADDRRRDLPRPRTRRPVGIRPPRLDRARRRHRSRRLDPTARPPRTARAALALV
ncbi:MAG TPA: hypothetical protein VK510_19315 [Solirubrobacteraceae bacterium]|nr:hypothetical protein [Solirubrobacteraceae bacterium]